MTTPEQRLSEFVRDLEYGDLPASVRDRVGLVVADTIGVIVGGATLPEVRRLAELEAVSNPGSATILGTDQSASPGHAALVNGTGGTSLELDEGHKYAAGHPAIHAFPAVLAETEVRDLTPEAFLASFVAGYEVGTRVARACSPLVSPYHMHGLWGTVGTAAAVAYLRRLPVEETTEALRIAANHALHTHFGTALEGATVRNTYAGASNLAGVQVANQVEAGFTGLSNGIERHLSRTAESFDESALTDGLGTRWEVDRGYFKLHAACRYTHPVLDAISELASETDLDPDRVESVTVQTYGAAAKLTQRRPETPLEAKFSIPFAVATRIVNGHSRKQAFTEAAFTEPVFDLAQRVSVEEADDLSARVPEERGARVLITMTDGTTVSQEVRQARGGVQRPFDESELRGKFTTLVEPVLGSSRASDLWDAARTPSDTRPARLCSLASLE